MYQWSRNYSPQAQLNPLTAFVNKVLLAHSRSLIRAFMPALTFKWQRWVVAKLKETLLWPFTESFPEHCSLPWLAYILHNNKGSRFCIAAYRRTENRPSGPSLQVTFTGEVWRAHLWNENSACLIPLLWPSLSHLKPIFTIMLNC